MIKPQRRAKLRRLSQAVVASLGLTLLAGAPLATAAPTADDNLEVEIVHTNPNHDGIYEAGDVLEFSYRVLNLTNVNRSTELISSNLVEDERCKWSTHQANAEKICTFPRHVITEADLETGSFTPEATWRLYESMSFQGGMLSELEVSGDSISTTKSSVDISRPVHTNSKAVYELGDVLEFSFDVTSTSSQVVNVVLTDGDFDEVDNGELLCTVGGLEPGETAACTVKHTVNESDLARHRFTPNSSWEVRTEDSGSLLQKIDVTGTSVALFGTLGDPVPDFDASWSGEPMFQNLEKLASNGVGFANYRIVALTVTNDGDVLASYDGRPTAADSPGPNSILQHRSTDNGETWGAQEVIAAGKTSSPILGYSDPSYIVDRVTGEIFNFHVYSMDAGFGSSQVGTDVNNRNVIHANVARSTDNGQTWESETITADITPDEGWRSRFAASGQGIQLKYGPYAGRLIQQFTIINGQGDFQALSVYSDDHGATWQAGEPVGVGMDENKTVELSDGRVMLNSRDSARSGFRKVAISEDGGHTYGEVKIDTQLTDPTNNASIVRAFPNAEMGSAEAKILLFSNSANQSSRTDGTIRMSCDDGETWPISKVFEPAGMGYSTLATLPDGNIGILYEPDEGFDGIQFAKFNLAWLDGICVDIAVDDVAGDAGETVDVSISVTNQSGESIEDGALSLELPSGWSASEFDTVSLSGEGSGTFQGTVTIPKDAYSGQYTIDAVLSTDMGVARTQANVTVNAEDGAIVTVVPTLRDPQTSYEVGDTLNYDYRVTNLADYTIALQPHSDDLEGFSRPVAPNCGYGKLDAGESYTCTTAHHVLTEADFESGEFSPVTSWNVHEGTYDGEVIDSFKREGPRVDLLEHSVTIAEITAVDSIEVPFGTSEVDALAMLSPTTTITDSEGGSQEVSLNWAIDSYDGDTAGNYQAEATFQLPAGIEQPEEEVSLVVTATITVVAGDGDGPGEGGSGGEDPDGGTEEDGSEGDGPDGGTDPEGELEPEGESDSDGTTSSNGDSEGADKLPALGVQLGVVGAALALIVAGVGLFSRSRARA